MPQPATLGWFVLYVIVAMSVQGLRQWPRDDSALFFITSIRFAPNLYDVRTSVVHHTTCILSTEYAVWMDSL